jgi:hypothetical protein
MDLKTVNKLNELLATHSGRDKINKLVQYGSRVSYKCCFLFLSVLANWSPCRLLFGTMSVRKIPNPCPIGTR